MYSGLKIKASFILLVASVVLPGSFTNLLATEIRTDTSGTERNISLFGTFQYGSVMQTNDFMKGLNSLNEPVKPYRAAAAGILVQTTGNELWEQLYNYPSYGVGFYKPVFPNAPYLGNPFAFYGTVSFPIKRTPLTTYSFDMGFGMVFNWRSHREDRYNIALGSSESVMFMPSFSVERKIIDRLMVNVGAGFVHFSNGSLKLPNKGINVLNLKAGLSYNFYGTGNSFKYQDVPKYPKNGEVYISAFMGWRNMLYLGNEAVDTLTQRKGVFYKCYGIAGAYNYQVNHKSKFGIGLMADYLGYVNSSMSVEDEKLKAHPAPFSDGFEVSIYPSYELVMGRASLVVQPGFYLYRSKYPEKTPFNYQRVGLKYYFTDNISMAVNMRAHYWSIADFIEWTIGFSIR